MRRAIIAALSLSVAWLAMPVTPALAASNAKVVVVVGPVGSSTAHYKDDANEIVAEARRHTSNVVKLYTPNATWSKVRAAAQSASVFVYLGHGNGWPSKYPPFQTVTKNGLGLDPSTGADGTKTVYYGEDYIRRDIRLAPNAVVLLYHLCYASGNTEPGLAVGSFADSRERVDNYGAGFIGAGARAVIAEGHPAHPVVNYVRQLFTTNRTMESVFRSAPTFHGNVLGPYAAQRSPGLAYLMDPDSSAPSGFYRSIVGDLSLTASKVVGSGLVPTNGTPLDFVVPGAAEVVAATGAGLWAHADNAADPASTAPTTLAAGTRLRVTGEAPAAADGTRILEVKVLGAATTGFVRSTAVAPRDSDAAAVWSLDQSAAMLSPNGDNEHDGFVAAARFSEPVSATLTVKNAGGTTVKSMSLTDDITRFAWDLRSASDALVPDGAYTWTLKAGDAWGNSPVTRTGTFTVDATAPVSTAASTATAGANGWLVSAATVSISARDATSGVKWIAWRVNDGDVATYGAPAVVGANGTVEFQYRATDRAGIREAWKTLTLRIDTKAPSVAFALSGEAGAEGLWRGPVTVTPTVKDPTSGVATRRYSVDDGAAAALGGDPIVVTGDGAHTVTVTATDQAGNRGSASTTFTIDTADPVLSVPEPGATPPVVTPNGDGVRDTVSLPFTVSEPGSVTMTVTGADATVVRTITAPVKAGEQALAWDGRSDAGAPVPDGRYTASLTATDAAGNVSEAATAEVDVYAALAGLARSPVLFFPQDGDALAPKTAASWTLLAPATVSVRVVDLDGRLVRTGVVDKAYPAGPATWAWDGRTDAGAFAARAVYRIVVVAGNGTQSATQATTVQADAFKLASSVTTAVRGRSLVVTAVTAEPLASAPRLVVRQPGLKAWSVTMTKKGATGWTATITPRRGGSAGTMRLVVRGTDARGGTNASTLLVALR